MPTPGFPDWLGVGAVVRNIATSEYRVVTRIEFQPATHPERQAGRYVIQLNQHLGNFPTSPQNPRPAHPHQIVTDLQEMVSNYAPTGDWLDEWEHIVSTGTTHPIVMAATALQPMGRLMVQGSGLFDGEYMIQSVTHHMGAVVVDGSLGLAGFDIELRTQAMLQTPENIAPMEMDGAAYMPDVAAWDVGVDQDEDRAWPPPGSPEIETGMPQVDVDQVWLLPLPNEGLWRTSFTQHVLMARDPGITLSHTRERDRVMRCTSTWLIEHGVRQEPPDPRANRPGHEIVIGQIWEFNPAAGKRYRQIPRWRVHTINEGAGKVCLMAADGSGKRIYLPTSRIVALATYAGDGIPRRTAFEHILDDADAD